MPYRYDEVIDAAMSLGTAGAQDCASIRAVVANLTRAAVDLIEGVDCADVLLIDNGTFHYIAATSLTALEVDEAQQRTGQGPCIDAADREVIVRSSDLRSDVRWPQFARLAQAAGVLSVVSFRLYIHGTNSGALNLFGFGPGSLTAQGEAAGAMLAAQAALLILIADRQQQFESALASRDVIGQAKGIIMERFDLDAAEAFELLTRTSQQSNTSLRVIAERLIIPNADKSTA